MEILALAKWRLDACGSPHYVLGRWHRYPIRSLGEMSHPPSETSILACLGVHGQVSSWLRPWLRVDL